MHDEISRVKKVSKINRKVMTKDGKPINIGDTLYVCENIDDECKVGDEIIFQGIYYRFLRQFFF